MRYHSNDFEEKKYINICLAHIIVLTIINVEETRNVSYDGLRNEECYMCNCIFLTLSKNLFILYKKRINLPHELSTDCLHV